MNEMQVAILEAAVLGGALAEDAQLGDPSCQVDALDAVVQAGHEALCQLQGNAPALEGLAEAATLLLTVFGAGVDNAGPLVKELLA